MRAVDRVGAVSGLPKECSFDRDLHPVQHGKRLRCEYPLDDVPMSMKRGVVKDVGFRTIRIRSARTKGWTVPQCANYLELPAHSGLSGCHPPHLLYGGHHGVGVTDVLLVLPGPRGRVGRIKQPYNDGCVPVACGCLDDFPGYHEFESPSVVFVLWF